MAPFIRRLVTSLLLALFCFSPADAQDMTLNDLSLRQAIVETAKNNFDIALERVKVLIAEKELIKAESEFDPVIGTSISKNSLKVANTSAFASPEIGESETFSGEMYLSRKAFTGTEYKVAVEAKKGETNSVFQSLNPSYNTSLKLEITQPLLKGSGKDVNKWRIHSSVNNEKIGKNRLKTGMSAALTETHTTYWELFFRVEELKAKKEALKMARDHEKRVRAQVEVGSLAPIEIVQAEAFVATSEEEVLKAENVLLRVSDLLLKLMNPQNSSALWEGRLNPIDKPEIKIEPVDLKESVEIAFIKRPELIAIKEEVKNRRIELVYYKNQQWPSLDLIGTLSLNGIRGRTRPIASFGGDGSTGSSFGGSLGDAFSDSLSGDYYNYLIGLRFTYPLGNRGAKSSAAIATLRTEETLLKLKSLEKDIVLEVRDAVRQIDSGKKQIKAAQYARILAERKLEAEIRKFEVGASTSFSVLEFQKDLTAERSHELRAMAETRKAIARYYKAIGSSLEYSGLEFNFAE